MQKFPWYWVLHWPYDSSKYLLLSAPHYFPETLFQTRYLLWNDVSHMIIIFYDWSWMAQSTGYTLGFEDSKSQWANTHVLYLLQHEWRYGIPAWDQILSRNIYIFTVFCLCSLVSISRCIKSYYPSSCTLLVNTMLYSFNTRTFSLLDLWNTYTVVSTPTYYILHVIYTW